MLGEESDNIMLHWLNFMFSHLQHFSLVSIVWFHFSTVWVNALDLFYFSSLKCLVLCSPYVHMYA